MTNLRELARGKPCMIRLPGCTGGGEDTVLAHYRMAGLCGVGQKPPDVCGAWACHVCHDHVDRRVRALDLDFVRLAHADGVMRTLARLVADGLIFCAGTVDKR